MAVTSGTYNSTTYLAQDVIGDAMKLLRVLPAGGTPTTNDLTDALRHLNNILKRWETKGLMLWLYDLVTIPLIQNQYKYTIGPGADIDPGYRPLRAMEGSFLRYTCEPCPNDVALQLLSRVEYLQMANKICPPATPNAYYYDVQMGQSPNPTSYNPYSRGWGVLYIYPVPAQSIYSTMLNVQRPIQDVTGAGQSFDLPLEWYDTLVMVLAARIGDLYEVPDQRLIRLKQEAMKLEEDLADWGSQEWAPMWFEPDFQQGMR